MEKEDLVGKVVLDREIYQSMIEEIDLLTEELETYKNAVMGDGSNQMYIDLEKEVSDMKGRVIKATNDLAEAVRTTKYWKHQHEKALFEIKRLKAPPL